MTSEMARQRMEHTVQMARPGAMICQRLMPLALRATISLSDDILPKMRTVATRMDSGRVKRSMSGIISRRKRTRSDGATPLERRSKARKKWPDNMTNVSTPKAMEVLTMMFFVMCRVMVFNGLNHHAGAVAPAFHVLYATSGEIRTYSRC